MRLPLNALARYRRICELEAAMNAEGVVRLSVRAVGWLIVAAALAYPMDWVVWKLRGSAGMAELPMAQMTSAPLKGNKTEFYYDGEITVDCSRSLFPEGSASPCWYLRRHPEMITQY